MLKGPVLAGALMVFAYAAIGQGTGFTAQSQPPPQGTGLISGQVIDADTGKGIPNAPVALHAVPAPGAPPQGRGGGPNRPFVVTSDSQGRFFFGGLAAGSYMPKASDEPLRSVSSEMTTRSVRTPSTSASASATGLG